MTVYVAKCPGRATQIVVYGGQEQAAQDFLKHLESEGYTIEPMDWDDARRLIGRDRIQEQDLLLGNYILD